MAASATLALKFAEYIFLMSPPFEVEDNMVFLALLLVQEMGSIISGMVPNGRPLTIALHCSLNILKRWYGMPLRGICL